MQIAICGGGNAAHTLAGILSSRQGNHVHMFLPFGDEASRWQQNLDNRGEIIVSSPGGERRGRPHLVSSDPAAVIPGSKVVLLALPAFAHETILKQIGPHLSPRTWVGALPARGGFDLCALDSLPEHGAGLAIFGFQTLPWACRIQTYGQQAVILGTKAVVDMAAWPSKMAGEIAETISDLLELPVEVTPSFLGLTLAGTGQIIHPGIMYGLFHHWDGSPYALAPYFYQNVDAEIAQTLQALSDEIQELRHVLEARFPAMDLSDVRPLLDWVIHSYAADIGDRRTLQSCFSTNRSYAGLKAPMLPVEGGLVPDFQARYLTEDIPYALIATKGIAELCGLPTPMIDQIITWAQSQIGKAYLEHGRLNRHAITETRAPQRYGYQQLDVFIKQENYR